MNFEDKIFVAGHNGLVGSSITAKLSSMGYKNIIVASRNELNLTNQKSVDLFFKLEKPKFVFLAAAKVGGIYANSSYSADFIYQNLMIEVNVINACYKYGTKRLVFLGSSCIYPRDSDQPIKENFLLSGRLETTNEPYAIAKIAGIKLCESFNKQYKTDFRSVMPTNLYGQNDYFHNKNSHVIPALIQRFHVAKISGQKTIDVWGSGIARREFLHVDDMADATIFIMKLDKASLDKIIEIDNSHINIGSGEEVTIKELAELIKDIVGYSGKIHFDKSKPDGMLRKLLDSSRIEKLGWKPKISLNDGISLTYEWFKRTIENNAGSIRK